jgi:hypothetical protein
VDNIIFKKRSLPDTKEVVLTRRKIPVQEVIPIDWETVVTQHLRPINRWMYGSLNKAGELFTIRSLSVVHVPKGVIDKMLSNKQIALGEDDYYYIVK